MDQAIVQASAPATKWSEFRGGWPILLGGSLGLAMGLAGVNFYTSGLFVKSLEGEFGWSRSQVAAVAFAVPLTVVLTAPFAGLLIDRVGVRLPVLVSMISLALGFAALGSMTGSFPAYLAISVVMAALAVASTPISFSRSVNEHFHVGRGLALGLTLCGTGLAAAFAPSAIAAIIVSEGWRTAYFRLAAIVLVAAPVVFLLLGARRGATSDQRQDSGPALPPSAIITYGMMIRDPRFTRLLVAFFVLALGVSGFILHMVPMLTDVGTSSATAAAVQARLGIAVVAGRLITGALVDYFFAPRVAAVTLSLTVAGIVALAILGPSVAPISAFAIGFALGAEVDLIGYLTVRYFGLGSYGRIYGILYGAFALGSGTSPLMIALIEEQAQGYVPALWTCAACVSVAIVLLATAPRFPAGEAARVHS